MLCFFLALLMRGCLLLLGGSADDFDGRRLWVGVSAVRIDRDTEMVVIGTLPDPSQGRRRKLHHVLRCRSAYSRLLVVHARLAIA